MAAEASVPANLGVVVSVRGDIVDARFDERVPAIYALLRAEQIKRLSSRRSWASNRKRRHPRRRLMLPTAHKKEKIMQVQVNTDHHIKGHEALVIRVRATVEGALSRFSDHITRVEVHVSDENGDKHGQNDKRCAMEARLEGRQPVAVTRQAATVDEAIDGAAGELARLIEHTLGRLRDRSARRTDPPPPGSLAVKP